MTPMVIMKVWPLESLTDYFDEKSTPEFVGKIQAMINNDPSKSIKSIVRDMGAN